ncbi:hypothetical protein ACVWXN_006865 [Bradyrhizobium sp. i1.4.4]
MKNYAGHRLSPWLGHLMVSRQETSRPLLTPGEVMQLSPKDAVVMISGVHPVRATKVRYYEDPQFQRRVLKPPRFEPRTLSAGPDDWSAGAPIPPSVGLLTRGKRRSDEANGGLRREPELPKHEEIEVKAPLGEHEFDTDLDEGDDDAVQAQALNRSMQGVARTVSLDADDGMDL